eukprot:CAMPEP_0185484160 /NCGR_PEP_ID=MMETSP1366-20130426/9098_1 /TAXON_ID=38817 /ORGANISM="Gephyrocapsa oceanica, Strain RCC1303" /LENGTH=573 /DNA_ID=CAMNT_0028092173 /DNA_START=23 /DNA_END=1739 /DNA_ORIENTATION=-
MAWPPASSPLGHAAKATPRHAAGCGALSDGASASAFAKKEGAAARDCPFAALAKASSAAFAVPLAPLRLEPLGQLSHPARGVVRVEEEELEREDEVLQQRLPREREVRQRALAALVVGRPGRVEKVDDQVRREAREQRDGGRAWLAPADEGLQRLPHRLRLRRRGAARAARLGERARQLERVLDRLAAALAEVWHHRVHGVAHEHHSAVGPRAEELRRPVVQVSLLDRLRRRRLEDADHLVGPACVLELEVGDHAAALRARRGASLPRVSRPLGARRLAQKGVPLHAPVPDVRSHKVLSRTDVHLVPALEVVGKVGGATLRHELAREDRVPRVRAPLPRQPVCRRLPHLALSVHLRTHGGPDPVRADEDVRLGDASVGECRPHSGLRLGVAGDGGPVDDEVRLDGAALVQQDVLQVRPVDHPRVRQVEEVSARLERKLEVPVGRRGGVEQEARVGDGRHPEAAISAQPVLDATPPRAREGEVGDHPLKQPLVNRLERRERVGGKLDGAAEAGELARLLVDGHIEARLEHCQRRRQPTHAAARDRHGERPTRDGRARRLCERQRRPAARRDHAA